MNGYGKLISYVVINRLKESIKIMKDGESFGINLTETMLGVIKVLGNN